MPHSKRVPGVFIAFLATALTTALAAQGLPPATSHLGQVLIVGGGPNKTNNQVAIESNVRYLGRILGESTPYQVLFADGDLTSETVQFRGDGRTLAYRAPDLPRLDGRADLESVRDAISKTAKNAKADKTADVVLYFTGHGTGDRQSGYTNNYFALWSGGRFTVKELAKSIDEFPKETPLTLIMVQCYSGAFGNVLFEDGDPNGKVLERPIAGFFAAVPERTSAGCTPAINEAEYRDFTGYFFAALTGSDRMGRPITGADYDNDSRVMMDEAFAWSLINDDSIDTPVCTTDTFVRRIAPLPDADIALTPYPTLLSWATPAQAAALEGLSKILKLDGETRLHEALARFSAMRPNSQALGDVKLVRFINLMRTVAEVHAIQTSDDEKPKRRLAEIQAAEHRNPFGK